MHDEADGCRANGVHALPSWPRLRRCRYASVDRISTRRTPLRSIAALYGAGDAAATELAPHAGPREKECAGWPAQGGEQHIAILCKEDASRKGLGWREEDDGAFPSVPHAAAEVAPRGVPPKPTHTLRQKQAWPPTATSRYASRRQARIDVKDVSKASVTEEEG